MLRLLVFFSVLTTTAWAFLGTDCTDAVLPAFTQGNFIQDVTGYYLSGFLPTDESRKYWRHRDLSQIPLDLLPTEMRPLLSDRLSGGSPVELFLKLRSPSSSQLYLEHRHQRQAQFTVPTNKEDLRKALGYDLSPFAETAFGRWVWNEEKTWRRRIVAKSVVKAKQRTIYRHRDLGVSVSTTEDDNQQVLETEIAVKRDDESGNWDFYAYSPAGALASHSNFAQGTKEISLPVPYTCLACHYNQEVRRFERFPTNLVRTRRLLQEFLGP